MKRMQTYRFHYSITVRMYHNIYCGWSHFPEVATPMYTSQYHLHFVCCGLWFSPILLITWDVCFFCLDLGKKKPWFLWSIDGAAVTLCDLIHEKGTASVCSLSQEACPWNSAVILWGSKLKSHGEAPVERNQASPLCSVQIPPQDWCDTALCTTKPWGIWPL